MVDKLKAVTLFASVLAGPAAVAPLTATLWPEWLWAVAAWYAVLVGAIYYWAVCSGRKEPW